MSEKVLFIGPSSIALEKFDYSALDQYDIVARTNTFLDCDTRITQNRCDIIFVNEYASRYYLSMGKTAMLDKLKNTRVLVKSYYYNTLMNRMGLFSECIIDEISEIKNTSEIVTPYIGTVAIYYLAKYYEQVDVCGIDFYESGIGRNAKYTEGYKTNYSKSKGHNPKKDLEFLIALSKTKSINFLHKTKEIVDKHK